MFHLTLSSNISNVFEGFCILKRTENIKCLYAFPSNYSFERFYEFIFPCNCPKERSEEYCVVTSNASNDRSFLLCRYSDVYGIYLCIYSFNPWFEIFSKLLFNLCHDDFLPNKFNCIGTYLRKISDMFPKSHILLPPCNANDNVAQTILKSSMTYPYIYDRYIQEYITANNPSLGYTKQLWLEVFWSMLLERPIIFMSKRFQKLTSSLLAATFFLHPLSWSHKFVSIIPQKNPQLLGMNCCMLGIHSCMEPILEKTDFWNEALLVDLDKGVSFMVGASDNERETQSRFKVPKYIKNFFINHIQMVDESVSSNCPYKIKDLISNTPWYMNEEETMYNEYKKGFHIYPLLFRTIISMLIGSYRQFIYPLKSSYEFDKERFILSNPKLTEFLKLFVQSQCFDSFIAEKLKCIEQGQDMNDRFDRERQELPCKNKVKVKERKLFRIKSLSGFHFTNDKTMSRLEKIRTMPYLKQKVHKKDKVAKAKFHVRSLSSSVSSLNSTTNMSQENLDDNVSHNSDSFLDQIFKGLVEMRIINDPKYPNHLSNISTKTIGNDDDILKTPINEKSMTLPPVLDDCMITKDKFTHSKPMRPLFKPGETPAGKVQNMVQQINHGNLDGNFITSDRKKSSPQIKPSELPNNKPVAQLASLFEQKPSI